MSHTPQPDKEVPICPECHTKKVWDTKWADFWCPSPVHEMDGADCD